MRGNNNLSRQSSIAKHVFPDQKLIATLLLNTQLIPH